MLHIKQVKNLKKPLYPHGTWFKKPDTQIDKISKISAASAFLLALTQGCHEGADPGNMIMPVQLSEAEARLVIEDVFSRNSILLENEVPLVFSHGEVESAELNLDGYNDSLKIGYEYASDDSNDYIFLRSDTIINELENAIESVEGPFIKCFNQYRFSYHEDESPEPVKTRLDSLTQDFIDSLRARGIL